MLHRKHIYYGILAVGAVACDGSNPATGPKQPAAPRPSFQTITPPSGSLTLAPTSNQQGIASTVVVSYAGPTLVQVHASGTVHVYAQPAGTDEGLMGAGGVHSPNSGACTGNVYISNGANFIGFCAPQDTPQPPRDPWDTTYVVTGDVNVGWVQGPMTGGTETFTGGPFVVTITPVSVDYNVTANPTTLNYNDTVTVTATVNPSQVNGLNVPWSIDSTTWAPAFGTQASPCAYGNWVTVDAGTRTCRKPFTRSGTLTVFSTVEGTKQQNAFSITVTPPTLKATASPSTIQGPQHVTFTATATPSTITWSLSGQGWTWTPDHHPDSNYLAGCTWQTKTCNPVVQWSGWMKATATIGEYALADSVHVTVNPPQFKVTASPNSIPGPQSVTFTATVTPTPAVAWNLSSWTWTPDTGTGGINNYCAWYENPCTRTISKSGWMKASTVIGEYTLVDSAHVTDPPPCHTGNPMIDSPEVQQGMNDLFTSTLHDGVEHGGWLMQRTDGSYYIQSFGLDFTFLPCGIDPPPGAMPPAGAVSWIHVHPWANGDKMVQCPERYVFGGVSFPYTYTNDESNDDDKAAAIWGPGWLIDKNLIFKFDSTGAHLETYQRCGY